jgi:hypothetical protein
MKHIPLIVVILIATLLLPQVAASQEQNFELTPFAAYRFGGTFDVEQSDASYELDDSESFGMLFNVRQSANTQWEVLYSKQNTNARLRDGAGTSPSVDTDIHVLQLGGTYQGDGKTVRPYVAMTLGGTHVKTVANGSQSDTFFSGSIGLGVQIRPGERLGFRLEARAYGTLTDSSTDLFCQTGPDVNLCAIRIDGQIVTQFETFAGVVFRF